MKRLITMYAAILLATIGMSAQNINLRGRVTDSSGAPLVAVTVYEQGKPSNGTTTDLDGRWTLAVSSDKSVVVFSCLGFTEVTQAVGASRTLEVKLEEEKLALEEAEVVAVGYGTVARRDLTGSVSKVDMGDVLKSPVVNFDQALTGRVAGVMVSTSDGELGEDANIVIRGSNSLTQSSAPLFIIDGFPSESSMAGAIDAGDIESIDILKDASATAIYGARGANGVIVITTKKGAEGRPKISFTSSWTMSHLAKRVDVLDPYDFVALQTEMYEYNDNTNIYLKPTDEDLSMGVDAYPVDIYRDAEGYDWQDLTYRTSLTQKYNLSVSGGNRKLGNNYALSLSATDQDGIIKNSNYQRYGGRFSFEQKLGRNVVLDVLANYSHSVKSGPTPTDAKDSSKSSGWLMYSIWAYRPVVPVRSSGDLDLENELYDEAISQAYGAMFNPVMTVNNEHRKRIKDIVSVNGSLSWTIIEGLKLKILGGYDLQRTKIEKFNGSQTYSGNPMATSGKGVNGSIVWQDRSSWLNENTLTWSRKIRRNHSLNLLAGFTLQGEDFKSHGVSATQITAESLGLAGLHTGNYQVVTPDYFDTFLMSGLFRLNYNYKFKYYLTASFRADGSSKFAKGNKWGYFPSIGASWNFTREGWMQRHDWISNGKLRASWGYTGNNRTNTPYDFYSKMIVSSGSGDSFDYVFDSLPMPGYYLGSVANRNLKWETTEQVNVGVDISFLESRIKLTADWYLKNTRDLLLNATIPASSGFATAMMNIGSMKNEGVELTLGFVPVKTDKVVWNIDMNVAWNQNTVTALSGSQNTLFSKVSWSADYNEQNAYVTQVGKPAGMMYGLVYEGTYKPEDFIESHSGASLKDGIPYLSSVGKSSVRPGDARYKDINEDGIVDDNDRTVIGYGQPIATGGFGTSLKFYGFDFNAFFSWCYGNDILNANRLEFETASGQQSNKFATYKNRWTPENPRSDIPRIYANGTMFYSSRVVEDGSYLKLRNISLGYTLPKQVLKKMKFDSLRVYVSADNIATFTNYSGPDPEVSTKHSVLTPGFDWSAYPRAFGVTAGLSFTF